MNASISTPSYAERFFGGVLSVKEQLVAAIQDELVRRGWTGERLNKICGFGKPRARDKPPLPATEEFLKDPSRLNSLVFSLASFPLALKADNILRLSLSPEERAEVTKDMEQADAGAKFAAGGMGLSDVALQDQAKLYVLLKALDEIDCA